MVDVNLEVATCLRTSLLRLSSCDTFINESMKTEYRLVEFLDETELGERVILNSLDGRIEIQEDPKRQRKRVESKKIKCSGISKRVCMWVSMTNLWKLLFSTCEQDLVSCGVPALCYGQDWLIDRFYTAGEPRALHRLRQALYHWAIFLLPCVQFLGSPLLVRVWRSVFLVTASKGHAFLKGHSKLLTQTL